MSAFKRRRAEMEQPECEACGSTAIVMDQKEGHMVCDDCGVIKRQSMISTNSEYRNFSESDKPTGDPTRVAAGPLGMNIAAVGGDMAAYGLKMKGNMLNSTSDRFRQANKQIADLVIKMGLPDEVKSKAQEVYALYGQAKDKISDMPAMAAAAVFEGARICDVGRTYDEVSRLASTEKTMRKRLWSAHRQMDRVLKARLQEEAERRGIDVSNLTSARAHMSGDDQEVYKQHATSNVPRFGSDLNFHRKGVEIAKKVAQAIYSDDLTKGLEHQPWHGRQPLTLTAATLYICTFLGSRVLQPGLQRSLDDVSSICKVGKGTIEETYGELHPLLRSIVPAKLKPPMTEDDWAKFPVPDPKAIRKR